jgi:hypothetical protein
VRRPELAKRNFQAHDPDSPFPIAAKAAGAEKAEDD